MPTLKQNEYKLLLWGENNKFIKGLDPLGLQISSESTYSYLLSGITNLTNRIRYYGFYCWLLDYYAQEERNTDPYAQNCFIRRAELMLAIIMKTHQPDYTQVTGSNYAGKMVDTPVEIYDLKTNADKSDKTTYWKFPSGAFGQYYAGAMKELGLITRNATDNFICLNEESHVGITGVHLAKAYEANIPAPIKKLFISNVKNGSLSEKDTLALYQVFALNNIPNSLNALSEQQIYLNMLMAEDKPQWSVVEEGEEVYTHRSDSISFLLNYLEAHQPFKNYRTFNIYAYRSKGLVNGQVHLTLQLWYYYQLNELWQFGATSMLWVVLQKMNEQGRIHINRFTEVMMEFIGEELTTTHNIKLSSTINDLLPILEEDENTIANTIESLVSKKERHVQDVAGWAIQLLLILYKNNQTERSILKAITLSRKLNREGGILSFFDKMDRYQDQTLEDFINDFICNQIIYRHQLVAIRKTGNGAQSSLKFVLEENYLRHIDNFKPQFTSPRLNALLNILTDLRLIDTDKRLTSSGQEFLKKHTR